MFNAAHWHLLLNHVPVVGIPVITALLAIGILGKQLLLQRLSLAFIVVLALVTIPVFLTGEPAEEIVEDIPTVSHDIIEEHEEIAEVAFTTVEILGGLALIGLVLSLRASSVAKPATYVVLALSVACVGLLARTAFLGGHVRHAEIRSDWQGAPPSAEQQERDPGGG